MCHALKAADYSRGGDEENPRKQGPASAKVRRSEVCGRDCHLTCPIDAPASPFLRVKGVETEHRDQACT